MTDFVKLENMNQERNEMDMVWNGISTTSGKTGPGNK